MRCSGLSPDGRLVEFVELPRDVHPYLVATQAHPEFLSRPTRPHPLFHGLVAAALEHSRAARAPPGPAASAGRRRARDPRPGPRTRKPGARAPGTRGPAAACTTSMSSGRWSATRGTSTACFVTLRTDQVRMPDGDVAARDVVEHPGAVAIVALDEDDQVLLIRQYRHPVGHLLWEIPAGMRDVAGESPRATAERELHGGDRLPGP